MVHAVASPADSSHKLSITRWQKGALIEMLWGRRHSPSTAEAIAAFRTAKLAAGLKPKTIEKFDYAAGRFQQTFHGRLPLDIEVLQGWLGDLHASSLQDATKQLIFDEVKRLYDFSRGRYGIRNPFDVPRREGGLKRPTLRQKEPVVFTPEEMIRILRANQDHSQVYAALCVFYDTGARPGWVYHLPRSGVHGNILVSSGKMGEQTYEVSSKTREALLRWMMLYPGPGLWTQAHQRGFADMLREGFKRAGLTGSPYMLRRGVASYLREQGVSAHDLRDVLGHTSVTTSDHYVARSPGRAARIMRRHGPLAEWSEIQYQPMLRLLDDDEEKG